MSLGEPTEDEERGANGADFAESILYYTRADIKLGSQPHLQENNINLINVIGKTDWPIRGGQPAVFGAAFQKYNDPS